MIGKWAWTLCIAAIAAAPSPALCQIADIRQGTNISIALSPDGASLAVDLLGGLWMLPATGGGAVALVPAGAGIGQPRFDRTGRRLVVQRWLDGQWDLWLFDLETNGWRALTATPYDEREPEFSADKGSVVFAADPTGWFTLWELDLGDGALRQLTTEHGHSSFPTIADTGELAYVHVDRGVSTLRRNDGQGGSTELFRSTGRLAAPSWRPGGSVIAFDEIDGAGASTLRMLVLADEPVVKDLTLAEDVFPGRAAWRSPGELIYTADGQIWRRGIGSVARTPLHLFAAVGVPPNGAAASTAPLLDAPGPHRATGILGASTARNGALTAFAALGDLWLAERRGTRRLTDDAALDAFPNLSSDGKTLVFVSDRGGIMDLWQMNLDNGVVKQLTGDSAKPFALELAPSGTHVAYLETEGLGPWSESQLQWLDLGTPYRPTTIARSLYGARGLRFAATGGAVEIHVEASREPGGPREMLTFEPGLDVAAPSQTVLPADIEKIAPEWIPLASSEAYVIEVGRLFDGVRNDYLRHVDIHIDGQRITAVVPRGALPKPSKVIDARDAAVYPGLIDVHAHQSATSGERLGRAWLLNGVTTVREVTDDLADALERAESWASGRRLGPRLLIAPLDVAEGVSAGSLFAVSGGQPPAPGFGHLLHAQQRQQGLPGLALPAPLRELLQPTDGAALPYWRVSSGGATYQDTLALLLASETALSTGFAALSPWPGQGNGGSRASSGSLAALFSPGELGTWMRSDPVDPRVVAPLTSTVARIVRSGGRVTVTSDAPAVPYGYGIHTELALLASAGIPNDQVLRLASAGGAIALGLGRELGTVEAGKLADFVVVSGDPLARIADAATILATVRGGVWLSREELLKRPAAPAP